MFNDAPLGGLVDGLVEGRHVLLGLGGISLSDSLAKGLDVFSHLSDSPEVKDAFLFVAPDAFFC